MPKPLSPNGRHRDFSNGAAPLTWALRPCILFFYREADSIVTNCNYNRNCNRNCNYNRNRNRNPKATNAALTNACELKLSNQEAEAAEQLVLEKATNPNREERPLT